MPQKGTTLGELRCIPERAAAGRGGWAVIRAWRPTVNAPDGQAGLGEGRLAIVGVGPRVPRSTPGRAGAWGRLAIVGSVPRGGESRERARGVPKRTGDQVEVSGVNGGRRRRTAARGAHQPPFLGPWTKPRPGDAWPGVKGAGPTRGKGQPPQGGASWGNPDPTRRRQDSPGGSLPRSRWHLVVYMTIPATVAGSGGRGASHREGRGNPTRRGLAG